MGLKLLSGDFRNLDSIHPAKKGVNVPKKNLLLRGVSYYETVAIAQLEILAQTEKASNSGGAGGSCLGLLLWPLIGPIGLVLGLLSGSKKSAPVQEITFSCKLVDGRGFTAVCDGATYQELVEAFHRNRR